jgi:hypothetical protein
MVKKSPFLFFSFKIREIYKSGKENSVQMALYIREANGGEGFG